METYPIEIEPEQIVVWMMEEIRDSPSEFKVSARRATERRELPLRKELRLGEEEREDLSEIVTTGTRQITPIDSADGWRLTIVVEDEFGPRIFGEPETAEEDHEMELSAFYDLFIRPKRGNASAFVETDSADANSRVARLLKDIEVDRHGAKRGA
jgi:hypothetical protein